MRIVFGFIFSALVSTNAFAQQEKPVGPVQVESVKAQQPIPKPKLKPTTSGSSAQQSGNSSTWTDKRLCTQALNFNQSAFNDSGIYSDEIEELQRRGIDVEKCRAAYWDK